MKAKHLIFVTGATGFLGGHFLQLASRRNWSLRCLARKPPPAPVQLPCVKWIQGDMLAPQKWQKQLRGCGTLVHLATSPLLEAEKDPLLAVEIMIRSWRELMEYAVRQGVKRFIVASSAEVYGSPERLPISEETPLQPLSIYGFLKMCADLCAIRVAEEQGVSLCILCFFNLYGAAADGSVPRVVLRLFAERLLRDEPIILHASLRNSRDFLHVKDAAQALMQAVQKPKVEGVLNIGSGSETRLKDAAKQMARLARRSLAIDFRPNEGRLRRAAADIRRARKLLGFRPKVTLDQGLREVLDGVLRTFEKKPR